MTDTPRTIQDYLDRYAELAVHADDCASHGKTYEWSWCNCGLSVRLAYALKFLEGSQSFYATARRPHDETATDS